MRQPSKLRYVECELPDEVEKTLIAFEEDFDLRIKPFHDRLDDLIANDLPVLEEEVNAQIELREELVKGAPVQSLSSLAAIDEATQLTSPKRDDDDPETIRIDERKVGAAGICLVNGRLFRILSGHSDTALPPTTVAPEQTNTGVRNRLVALRYLWEMSGGNYDAFVRLGTSVYTNPESTYTLLEWNSFYPQNMPFINKGFSYLSSVDAKISQFRHRLLWTNNISASYALKTKLTSLGFSSEQINNIFSGYDPDADYDFVDAITSVQSLIANVTRLILLPKNDPVRLPPWENEANYIELAIKRFLIYRTKRYTSSVIFDKDFWKVFLTVLRPKDVKELLENRPEILDIELPQNLESITQLVERAVTIPSETKIINTYMNNLPITDKDEQGITEVLYDLGLSIYKQLVKLNTSRAYTRAAQIKELLLELIGKKELVSHFSPSVMINPAEVSALFPTTNLPSLGIFVSSVQQMGNSDGGAGTGEAGGTGIIGEGVGETGSGQSDIAQLINSALSANSSFSRFLERYKKFFDKMKGLGKVKDSFSFSTGTVQGLSSIETFAMLLARRTKWSDNFVECGEQVVGEASASTPATSQSMGSAYSFEETKAYGEDNETWRQHRDNMAYLETRIGKEVKSVADIRAGVQEIINNESKIGGSVNKKDTKINAKLAKINSQSDIKIVASSSVELLKSIPTPSNANVSTTDLYSDYRSGEERAWEQYAAKNRNMLVREEGKKPPGVTTADAKNFVEGALGQKLPFVGGSDKMLVPFSADVSLELQVCQTSALRQFDNYLKGLLTLPSWLEKLINTLRQQIQNFQDKIDFFIMRVQLAMDKLLAKMERLLTLDLNFSGKLGYENSLFKCSWGLDLGLKINLLDVLLLYLDRFLGIALGPFLNFLTLLGDFINEIFCIPIRWIGEILNGAASALSALLSTIGCTMKDFKLPVEVFDLLSAINATFSLRSLVLKKGSADWLKMMSRIKLGKDEFQGLSQFANMCANPNLSQSLSALQAAIGLETSDLPVSASKKGLDGGSKALSSMIA